MNKVNLTTEKKYRKSLRQFHRKDDLIVFESCKGKILLSQGFEFIRINFDCDWLLNIIIKKKEDLSVFTFQIWIIEQIKNRDWYVYATDGAKHLLYQEMIYITRFPIRSCQLWLIEECLFLPEEVKASS